MPPSPTYDHSYIENTQLIDRYVLDKLDPQEAEWFNNHFPECSECMDALELSEAFLEALRQQQMTPIQSPLVKRGKTPIWVGLALAAGLIIGLMVPKLIRPPATLLPIQETSNQVLLAERSTPGEPAPLVFLPGSQVATFTFPTSETGDRYQLTFHNQASQDQIQFKTNPARDTQMSVSLNRAFFKPGRYRLDIEIIGPDQKASLFAQHLLQVIYLPE